MIDTGSMEEAEKISMEACRRLLANPVMEDFVIETEEVN